MKRKKNILKINKKNNIDSIIEIFQQFEKKYEITLTQLDKNIQYEIKNTKITQTYKTTILNEDINIITKKLKNKGKITLIIIDNLKNKRNTKEVDEKIKKIQKLKNINTKIIKKNEIFKTLQEVIDEA